MDSALEFAIQLALETGEFLLKNFRDQDKHIRLKADRSLVTDADTAADQLIAQKIYEKYSQANILSEELNPTYSPEKSGSNQELWIVDPLDGTTNYSLGLHIWGVLLTRLRAGYPDLCVMNFPLVGELYTAERNQGAFLNSEPIQVQGANTYRAASFFACCSRTFHRYQVDLRYKPRILGSAAYSFCSVARGVALLGFEATPKIWDIAGAWLLVQEAGGLIRTMDGNQPFPLSPEVDYQRQNYPSLAAATTELLEEAQHKIRPKR